MATSPSTSVQHKNFRLDVRASVAVREQSFTNGVLYYLSLLDDEIDDRFEMLRSTLDDGQFARLELELTDAIILHEEDKLVVARGGSCTVPLFWTCAGASVQLSTALPLLGGAKFSRSGLASALAATCLEGSYEPNAWTETPVAGWQRIRRGAITTFRDGKIAEEKPLDFASGPAADNLDEDGIVEKIRAAFAAYRHSQRHVTSSVLELSGGFDSTLAGAGALSQHHVMRGVSVEFPYYEFRFEAPLQQSVGNAMGIPRAVVDGQDVFPFTPWENPPRFDEPSVFVTGIRHAERVASFAAANAASRIYVGHGGDQLFATDLTSNESVTSTPAKGPFSRDAWVSVRRILAQIQRPTWRSRTTGCFVYDARQDVWIKETFGPTIRTPFSDLAVFRAALLWSQCSARQSVRPDKTILSRALSDLLPPAVMQRKGKVAYDGVWMRAYAKHGAHIAKTLERTSSVLEHIGISPAWLLRQTRQLAEWQPVSSREVLGAYGISVWLISWGLEKVSDIDWEPDSK